MAPRTREIIGAGIFYALGITYAYASYHINDFNLGGSFTNKMIVFFARPGLTIHPDVEAQ